VANSAARIVPGLLAETTMRKADEEGEEEVINIAN